MAAGRHSDRGLALTPFRIFGVNALAAYVFGFSRCFPCVRADASLGVTFTHWLFHPLPAFFPNRYVAGLLCAVLYIGVCFLPVWLLYRKRIFLKV